MDDLKIGERFDHLETLIDSLATFCAREFKNIAERFSTVDARFEILEGKIDGISRRMDIAVEDRKKLEDRVSKIEEIIAH